MTFQGQGGAASEIAYSPHPGALAALEGEMFFGGTGELILSLAGNVRVVLANPAASGITLYVVRLDALSTAVGFAELFVNPTAGVPTVIRPINPANFGSGRAAKAQLFSDTNATTALGGGTDSGVSIGVGSNSLQRYELADTPLIVPPGVTMGVALPFSGAANATFNVWWFEAQSP